VGQREKGGGGEGKKRKGEGGSFMQKYGKLSLSVNLFKKRGERKKGGGGGRGEPNEICPFLEGGLHTST